ncbi:Vegetative incompatibility protein HET-E-1 [Apiospora marii]|uniref:Vegetative incompatibility protein HET-E-1 n=1 Tax=Apiospora marii TaxID=335849 RepID=UPI00312D5664
MRLLKTDQYKLVEVNDLPTPIPEYAILSHTWISPKDEITYQDFKQRKGDIENDIFKQKGWAKLREYCDRAARDGWEWAWMDTCCIDKTNPADTQEAINAMFRWYQSAGICYAYLDDVDANEALGRPVPVGCDLDDVAGRDNELLAPPYLVFVDRTWRRIGTRESWYDEIREASKIEEDETYSLLGLFGISLPLIYGEGRWRAFNRLQRELITVYNDDSIFAWKFESQSSSNGHEMTGSQKQKAANEHGRGILAPSIREYWDAASIEAFSFDNSFSMTNKGLEIDAQRWRRTDNTNRCLIRLNCGLGAFQHLAIPLLEHVDGTYGRINLDELYDMTMIRSQEWKEVPSKEPAVIRASNYSSIVTSSSVFTLDYPREIEVGNKYFVDFHASHPRLKSLYGSFSRPRLTSNELMVEPNRLVFINMELRSGASRFQLDVIINLDERSFPCAGVLALGQGTRKRLGNPLDETVSGIYVGIAEELHYQVATVPAYPAITVDEDGGAVVSVVLLPRPRKQRQVQGGASEANSATSREYVLKIRVQQDGDHDRPTAEPFLKRRRTEY